MQLEQRRNYTEEKSLVITSLVARMRYVGNVLQRPPARPTCDRPKAFHSSDKRALFSHQTPPPPQSARYEPTQIPKDNLLHHAQVVHILQLILHSHILLQLPRGPRNHHATTSLASTASRRGLADTSSTAASKSSEERAKQCRQLIQKVQCI